MIYNLIDDTLNIEISSIHDHTIQDFFERLIPSKKYQHLLIQNKWIMIDGESVKRETEIKGNTLSLNIYPENYYYEVNTDIEPTILYEDEIILVVNKPNGMLVHSDGDDTKISLCDIVESYFARNNIKGSAHPIHRLDKETQGVVLFSKSVIFQALLDQLLTYKHIRRTYLAFVDGYIRKGERIVIDAPIGKDRHSKSKQRVAQNGKEAKTIVTGVDTNGNYSIVECELKTGRTHQIRVHMAHIGHPILNDDLYGKPSKLCKDMGLVAVMIDFYHPLKEDMMEVEGYISSDLRKLMK